MVQKIKEVGSLQHFAISKNGETLVNFSISPYLDTDSKQLFSLSKTFTSMAIGKAYDEGLLSLDDKLVDIFTQEELAIFKRGRNAKKPTKSKSCSVVEYNKSTGIEAVIGAVALLPRSQQTIVQTVKRVAAQS